MDKQICPFDEISLGRGEILLNYRDENLYKHPQVCWPVCWDESSKMQLQAIFYNCQNYKIVLGSMVEFSHINTRQICLAYLTKQLAISGLTMSFSLISRQARTMKLAKSRSKLTRKHQVLHLM